MTLPCLTRHSVLESRFQFSLSVEKIYRVLHHIRKIERLVWCFHRTVCNERLEACVERGGSVFVDCEIAVANADTPLCAANVDVETEIFASAAKRNRNERTTGRFI